MLPKCCQKYKLRILTARIQAVRILYSAPERDKKQGAAEKTPLRPKDYQLPWGETPHTPFFYFMTIFFDTVVPLS